MNDSKHIDFFDGKLFRFMNYVYWVFACSTFILIMNIGFVFCLYVMLIAGSDIPFTLFHVLLLGVLAISFGPSLAAVYHVMNEIVFNGDVSIFKELMRGVKVSFKKALGASVTLSLFIIMTICNYMISLQVDSLGFLLLPLLLLLSLLLCVSLYIFPIISLNRVSIKQAFKLSLYFSIKEFKTTILLLILFACTIYLVLLVPTLTLFLLPGLYCLCTVHLLKKIYPKIAKDM